MEDKHDTMQDIFRNLTERNKDIVILLAKSMQVAQNQEKIPSKAPKESV